MRRQELNVFRMRLLGAEVRGVGAGSATLKDAINEAMRDWVTMCARPTTSWAAHWARIPTPPWCGLSARDRPRSSRTNAGAGRQAADSNCGLRGGGSNAIGAFYEFLGDKDVRLVGVEAAAAGPRWRARGALPEPRRRAAACCRVRTAMSCREI